VHAPALGHVDRDWRSRIGGGLSAIAKVVVEVDARPRILCHVGGNCRWLGIALIGGAISACGTISGLDEYSPGSQLTVDASVSPDGAESSEAAATMGPEGRDADGGADLAESGTTEGPPPTDGDDGAEASTADATHPDAEAGESGTDAAVDAGKSEAGAACMPGHADCNGGADCECATPACCNGACQTTHSTGVGQSFYDCTSQGTHNEAQAKEACSAFTGSSGACSQDTSGGCNCLLVLCGPQGGKREHVELQGFVRVRQRSLLELNSPDVGPLRAVSDSSVPDDADDPQAIDRDDKQLTG